jgi:hypothetical protein
MAGILEDVQVADTRSLESDRLGIVWDVKASHCIHPWLPVGFQHAEGVPEGGKRNANRPSGPQVNAIIQPSGPHARIQIPFPFCLRCAENRSACQTDIEGKRQVMSNDQRSRDDLSSFPNSFDKPRHKGMHLDHEFSGI